MLKDLAFKVVAFCLMMLFRERHDIGREGRPYLTRWVIWGERFGADASNKLYLHYFHSSDEDAALHDHPWPFWSLILWGGYIEVSQCGPDEKGDRYVYDPHSDTVWVRLPEGQRSEWYESLSLLRRPAAWAHRIVIGRRNPWTLVWCGAKERSWGWHCPDGWRHHAVADLAYAEGKGICD
jgi:hypothetical protein